MSRSSSRTVCTLPIRWRESLRWLHPRPTPRHGRLTSRQHILCQAASCPSLPPDVVHTAGVSGPRAAGSTRGGGRRRRVLTTIVDTVTAGRHRSTRVVTGCRGRPCGRPPPRSSPAGRAGGRTPRAKGTGPGPAWAQKLPQHQWWTSARGVAGSWRRIVSPAHPARRTNRWRRSCFPDGGGSRRIRRMPGACWRGSGRCDPGGRSAGTLANGLRAPRAASVCQHGGVWRGPWLVWPLPPMVEQR